MFVCPVSQWLNSDDVDDAGGNRRQKQRHAASQNNRGWLGTSLIKTPKSNYLFLG